MSGNGGMGEWGKRGCRDSSLPGFGVSPDNTLGGWWDHEGLISEVVAHTLAAGMSVMTFMAVSRGTGSSV